MGGSWEGGKRGKERLNVQREIKSERGKEETGGEMKSEGDEGR